MMRSARICLALLLASACNSADEPIDLATADIEQTYASLDTDDEAPDFADDELGEPELGAEDPIEADATVDQRPEIREGAHHLRVFVGWGRFRYQPEATDWLDWSGDVTVNNGAVRVLRTVRFERPMDHLLPREQDIDTVKFVSRTAPSWDGLYLDVILHPSLNPDGEEVSITFTSGPVTYTLPITRDMRRHVVVDVGDQGHKLVFQVFRPDGDGCREGYLAGVWRAVEDGPRGVLGVMKGRFVDETGRIHGKIRGVYGKRPDGAQVFFAKVIGRDGAFIGLIGGRYREGEFAGRLNGRGDRIDGLVHGRYFDGDRDHDGGFVGRWSQSCREEVAEGSIQPVDATPPTIQTGVAL
jgi:hypothetical protein